ncbi:MAG: two pore domain potassium channel family protein [Micrococcales bacterium]|uniref:ion channel n=1 Tax=Phycicoccus sp. TaxID=1902410 RepID=UPI0019C819FD|nr:ion channel [Phycicoccus sp.]MBD3783307.1 two pore domain potassium channel family protein [Micrococcales bacterium]HMM93758.1 ion channel [Phycicoccus sp.]
MSSTWEDARDAPPSTWRRWRATLRKQPSAFLLMVQVLVILLLPFLQDTRGGRSVISLLSLAAVVTAVFTVRSTPALTWLSATLAAPAAVLEVWSLVDETGNVILLAHAVLAVFYFYTAYALISYMFEDAWVTKDELFAVGAAFTVLLFAFAYLFLAIQELWPSSFTSVDGPGKRTFLELLYFSGANLTSVGLSDVGPVRPQARAVVTIEQLGGVLYVAMVISRLVALTVIRARQ